MTLSAVHHIAIICSDYAKSLAFYRDVLGMEVQSEHYRAARDSYKTDLALNGCYLIELFSFPDPPKRVTGPEAAGLRHLAFAVPDLAAAVRELDGKGVVHEDIRTDEFTGRRFVFFKDPDGLPIELYETELLCPQAQIKAATAVNVETTRRMAIAEEWRFGRL